MTSNSQINPQVSSVANVDKPHINSDANNYRASVPIFVYRELAGDLENTKHQLQQLRHVNEELVRQNQQLRQEIIKILQTAEQVQQTVKLINPPQVSFVKTVPPKNNFNPPTQVRQTTNSISDNISQESSLIPQENQENIIHNSTNSQTQIKPASAAPPKVKKSRPKPSQKQRLDFEDDENDLEIENSNNSNGLNGWLLFLAILLIVFTAFGAGFIVMRPLLNSNPNNNQGSPNLSQ